MLEKTASVAIATCNGESYIRKQLYSILSQTIRPSEIVLSDDCSSDRTVEIANSVLKKDGIAHKIIVGPRRIGFSRNFFRSLKYCSSPFIFVSDQDDYWFPHKIERMLAEVELDPSLLLVMHDAHIGDQNLRITKYSLISECGLSDSLYAYGFTMLLSSQLLQALPSTNFSIGHDLFFNSIANILCSKKVVHEPLAIYRRHLNALTYNTKPSLKQKLRSFFIYTRSDHKETIRFYQAVLDGTKLIISKNRNQAISHKALSRNEHLLEETKLRYACSQLNKPSKIISLLGFLVTRKISIKKFLKDIFSFVRL